MASWLTLLLLLDTTRHFLGGKRRTELVQAEAIIYSGHATRILSAASGPTADFKFAYALTYFSSSNTPPTSGIPVPWPYCDSPPHCPRPPPGHARGVQRRPDRPSAFMPLAHTIPSGGIHIDSG